MQDVAWADSYFATPQSGIFRVVQYLFSIFAHMYASVWKTLILPVSCQPFSLDTGLAMTSISIQMAYSREVFLSMFISCFMCSPMRSGTDMSIGKILNRCWCWLKIKSEVIDLFVTPS